MLIFVRCLLYSFLVFSANNLYAAKPITITHNQTLNFGIAAKPLSGSSKIVVNRAGNLGGGTTATMIDTSSVVRGENTIKGSGGNNSIQIGFEECSSNRSLKLKLKKFKARYSGVNFVDNGVALDAPGPQGTDLQYGATLVIRAGSATGELAPCYNIDVNYE